MLEQYLVTSQHKQTAYVPLLDPCTLERESQLKAVGQMAAKNACKHASIQRHALLQHERTVNITVHIPAILRRHAHAKESPCSCNACKSSQVRAKKNALHIADAAGVACALAPRPRNKVGTCTLICRFQILTQQCRSVVAKARQVQPVVRRKTAG